MKSQEIRKQFLDFFTSKSHRVVNSAPIVIKNDPTLMFTNAGMNQFKDYFLGNRTPEFRRVADTQKCLRVSGKHNDLEEVGMDTYHHTMFEMLGNWSFGDYFKKEAIEWAWELLIDVYKLSPDRMYVTIFEGDALEDLDRDTEAYSYWAGLIPEDRILNGNKKDNFWEMGDTGPCGPCSEIHIDLRSEAERNRVDGATLVNQDHPQVVEIWNLVFIQYNRKADSSLENLPDTHVDTGMGFERLCMAIQAKESNYDTDVFTPLIDALCSESGDTYGKNQQKDVALRVIADHIRAVSFTIADGQLPSNNKAGYVIRRILRRAVRYGYTFLGFRAPFMYKLVPLLATQFKDVFPELYEQIDLVSKVVQEEEMSFLRTLENGLKKLDVLEKSRNKEIDGVTAFELYDTFGFPLDLTELIAREKGMSVDLSGFQQEMEKQKNRSKDSSKRNLGDWTIVADSKENTFIGYDQLEAEVRIARYRSVSKKGESYYEVVLDQTPFYPEGGGQVGDTGFLQSENQTWEIINTVKENDLILHILNELPEATSGLQATVEQGKRIATASNHSATHLLHASLREVLGDHIQQKGSLVNSDYLRFDFSHFSKVTDEELQRIEEMVNARIREGIARDEKRNVPIEEATGELGATALFGEKYGDSVRVITFDPSFSVELCGGIHVQNTAQIGVFKIVQESAVAAGVRRIEAITSEKALEYINTRLERLSQIEETLKRPNDIVKAVEELSEANTALRKKIEKLENEQAGDLKDDLIKTVEHMDGLNVIAQKITIPNAQVLKQLAFDIRKSVDDLYLVLAANVDDKPQICVMLSDALVEKGMNANVIIKELSKEIKGGGGGQPFFATAGGKDISGLDNVVKRAKEIPLQVENNGK